MGTMSYAGPDRRIHKVFVTRNSEYHTRDGYCVAVRDLRTGEFMPTHSALGKHISSGVHFNDDGGIAGLSEPGHPHLGDKLCFTSDDGANHDLLTSPLESVKRPSLTTVEHYPK